MDNALASYQQHYCPPPPPDIRVMMNFRKCWSRALPGAGPADTLIGLAREKAGSRLKDPS